MLGTLLYQGTWIAEAAAAFAILLHDLYYRDLVRVVGLVAGFIVGFSNYIGILIPSVRPPPEFLAYAVLLVPTALTVAYGLRRRWVLFLLALVFCGGPMAYMFLTKLTLLQRPNQLPEFLALSLEFNFFLMPILAVLAGRELSVWIGSFVAKEQPV